MERLGGKLHGFWYGFGEHDGFVLIEAPNNVSAAAFSVGIAAGGSLRSAETTVLLTVEEAIGEVEIGWSFLRRSCWGGLYNGQMKELMLRHAFRFVSSVVFLISTQNLRSQRAVETIGGVRVEPRPHPSGQEMYVYQITALAFAQRLF